MVSTPGQWQEKYPFANDVREESLVVSPRN